MLMFKFTPISRIAITIVAIGYAFLSHYLIAGGLILQFLAICFGLGLTTLLIASLGSSSVDISVGALFQGLVEGQTIDIDTRKQSFIVGVDAPDSL
ncbi:MAG: hypothetical protein H6965_02365 [Chromatiaceae bacterium]|nr:hypothetical protein [Chromatiaceae bacterium]